MPGSPTMATAPRAGNETPSADSPLPHPRLTGSVASAGVPDSQSPKTLASPDSHSHTATSESGPLAPQTAPTQDNLSAPGPCPSAPALYHGPCTPAARDLDQGDYQDCATVPHHPDSKGALVGRVADTNTQDAGSFDTEKPKRRTARGKRGGKRHNKARKRAQAAAAAAAAAAGIELDSLIPFCHGHHHSSPTLSGSNSSLGTCSPGSLSPGSSSFYSSGASSRAATPERCATASLSPRLLLQLRQHGHTEAPVLSNSRASQLLHPDSLTLWTTTSHKNLQSLGQEHHENLLSAATMSLGSMAAPSLTGAGGHGNICNMINDTWPSSAALAPSPGECLDQGPDRGVSAGNGGVSESHQPEPRLPAGAVESFDIGRGGGLPPPPPSTQAHHHGQAHVGVSANAPSASSRQCTPDFSPHSSTSSVHLIHDPTRHSRSPLHTQPDIGTKAAANLGQLQWKASLSTATTTNSNNSAIPADPATASPPPPLTTRSSTSTLTTDSTAGSSAIDHPLPSPSVGYSHSRSNNNDQPWPTSTAPANLHYQDPPFRSHRPSALDLSAPAFSPLSGFGDSPHSASFVNGFGQQQSVNQSYSPTDPRFAKALQQLGGHHTHQHQQTENHRHQAQEDAYLHSAQYRLESMGSASDNDQLVLQQQLYALQAYHQQHQSTDCHGSGSATEAYLRQHYQEQQQQQQEYEEANKLRAQMSSSPSIYHGQQQRQHQHFGYPGASPPIGPSDARAAQSSSSQSPQLGYGHGYGQRNGGDAGTNGNSGFGNRSWSASEGHSHHYASAAMGPATAPTSRTASWTMAHERLAVTLLPPSPDHSSPASLYARRGVPLPSLRGGDLSSSIPGGGEFASYPAVPDRPFPSYLPSLAPAHSPHMPQIRRAPQGKPPKVFVSYLPPVYTVDDVARLFSPYGTIVSIKLLPTPNESLLPLKYRCGFVQFDRDTAVGACIHALHQFHLTLEGKRYILTVRNASDQAPVNNTNLMVKGLPNDMPEQRLFDTFSQFGRVTSVRIIRDRERTNSDTSSGYGHYQDSNSQHGCSPNMANASTRRPANNKGLAFVNYSTANDALRAIQNMHNAFIDGRRIHVSFAEKEYPYNVHVFDTDPGPEVAALQSGTPLPAKTTLPPPPPMAHTPTSATPMGMMPSPTLGHYAQARGNVYAPGAMMAASEYGYGDSGSMHYPTPDSASLRRERGGGETGTFGYLDHQQQQQQQQYSPMPEFRTVVVVKDIPISADESHVEAEYARYGELFQVRLFRQHGGGMTAVIAFTHPSSALRAVQERPHSTVLANDSFANTVAAYSDIATSLATPNPSPQVALQSHAAVPSTDFQVRPSYMTSTSPSLGAGTTAFAGRQPQPSPPMGSSLAGLPSPTVHFGAGAARGGATVAARARTYSTASSGSYAWSPALGQHASAGNSYESSTSDHVAASAAAVAAGSEIYDYHHHGPNQQAATAFSPMCGGSVNGSQLPASSASPTSSSSPLAHNHDLALSRSFADLALDASEPRRTKGFKHHHHQQGHANDTAADDESSIAPPAHVVSGVLTLVDQE